VRRAVQQPQDAGRAHVRGARRQAGPGGRVGVQALRENVRPETFVALALQERARGHGHGLPGLRTAVRQRTRTRRAREHGQARRRRVRVPRVRRSVRAQPTVQIAFAGEEELCVAFSPGVLLSSAYFCFSFFFCHRDTTRTVVSIATRGSQTSKS